MKNFYPHVKKDFHLIVFASLLSILSALSYVLIPVVVGDIINFFLHLDSLFDIKVSFIILITLCVTHSLFQWLSYLLSVTFSTKTSKYFQKKVYNKIYLIDYSTLTNFSSGEINNLIINDIDTLSKGLMQSITIFISGFATIVAILVITFIIEWKVALILILITPLSYLVSRMKFRYNWKYFTKQTQDRSDWSEKTNEYVSNLKSIRLTHSEPVFQKNLKAFNDGMTDTLFNAQFGSALINPSTRLVNYITFFSVLILSSYFAFKELLPIGAVIIFITYTYQFAKPFNEMTSVAAELQSMTASFQRISNFLSLTNQKVNTNKLQLTNGDIQINNVSFGYDPNTPVLHSISLNIKKGEQVAFVGPTGCGKTTLVNLITKFYSPNEGEILIDNQNIKDISQEDIRKHIGLVLQNTFIFNKSVKENIKIAKKDATDEMIIIAAKKARAHDFICRLENGYDTIVNNKCLSAGEKQLLAIARVILSDAPIIIMDEATANIDTRTELLLQESIENLTKNKTSLIVAHRLSTIKKSNKIVVMNQGEIIEIGTHAELLENKNLYFELYSNVN